MNFSDQIFKALTSSADPREQVKALNAVRDGFNGPHFTPDGKAIPENIDASIAIERAIEGSDASFRDGGQFGMGA